MTRTLSGIRTLWGAEWCQVGLDHSTTACPTLLPSELPHLYPLQPPHHHHSVPLLCGVTPPVALRCYHPLALTGLMERERKRDGESERQRERGTWGTLHKEGFAITAHILWMHSVIVADVCGCVSLM